MSDKEGSLNLNDEDLDAAADQYNDGPPFQAEASSPGDFLKSLLEDTLDVKLQMLEQTLIKELVKLRTDLQISAQRQTANELGLHSHGHSPEVEYPRAANGLQQPDAWPHTPRAANSPQQPDAWPNTPRAANGLQQPEANSNAMIIGECTHNGGLIHSPQARPQELKAFKRSYSKAGVKSLVNSDKENTSVSRDFVDKLMIRNELARMRKTKTVYHHSTIEKLHEFELWWNQLEEPPRTGCLAACVTARSFEMICVFVIAVNAAFIAFGTDWQVKNIGAKLPVVFWLVECICSIFFIVELCMRLLVHRLYFFVNTEMRINCFDFFIVLLGSLDLAFTFAEHLAVGNSDNENFSLARIARLLKLAKMFRTMRALRFFKDLVVIMEGIKQSLVALFWIFIMLGMLLFICALVFLQGMMDYTLLNKDTMSSTERELLERHFGSMWGSMLSLYSAVTGGRDWMDYYEIIAEVDGLYAAMFVGFTFFFLFAMFNILTGLFVEKAAVASKPDVEEVIMNQKKKAVSHSQELKSICVLLDEGETGQISWVDFERMMANPTVVAYMSSIGLEVHEPELFFSMICEATSEKALPDTKVPIDLFVERCMQLKGVASSIDSQRNLFELHLMRYELSRLSAAVQVISTRQLSMRRSLQRGSPHAARSPALSFSDVEATQAGGMQSPAAFHGSLQHPPYSPIRMERIAL